MFATLLATDCVLRTWKKNPKATKKEIGVWYHWQFDTPENNLPLSEEEVERMKKNLREYVPSAYCKIFPEEKI